MYSLSPRPLIGFQGENLSSSHCRIQIGLPLYELWSDRPVYQKSKEREVPREATLVYDSAFQPREECFQYIWECYLR